MLATKMSLFLLAGKRDAYSQPLSRFVGATLVERQRAVEETGVDSDDSHVRRGVASANELCRLATHTRTQSVANLREHSFRDHYLRRGAHFREHPLGALVMSIVGVQERLNEEGVEEDAPVRYVSLGLRSRIPLRLPVQVMIVSRSPVLRC